MKNKKIIVLLLVFTIIFTVAGGTLAYWNWQTSEEQKTNVVFTVTSNFSCAADGGGNITEADTSLAPASCTNSTYAIKREVTVGPTITQNGTDVYLDLWLKVNSIGSGLAASQNFKYALTTSSLDCTTGVVAQGNFTGATTNTQKTLLNNKIYSQTKTDTYYLWIWLDAAETDSATQNQSFSIELGGVCTDQAPKTIYTANLYDENAQGFNSVWIGQTVPNGITEYSTPEDAMAALKTAGGGATDYPFFLKHLVSDGNLWCATNSSQGLSVCIFENQSDCNSKVSDYGEGFVCQKNTFTQGVSESYVGFVVTPAMANANPGMTAGTYYLRGGDNGGTYNDNKATLLRAFSSTYCTDKSSGFRCNVSGLDAYAGLPGYVGALGDASGSGCGIDGVGYSYCGVSVDGGVGAS